MNQDIIIKKDVIGYEGLYFVTSEGEIFSHDRKVLRINRSNRNEKYYIKIKGLKIKIKKNLKGYVRCTLSKKGKPKTFSVHRVVAQAFLNQHLGQVQVNHKNGNKDDNRLENLEWVTPKDNIRHAIKTGLININGEKHYNSKLNSSHVLNIKKLIKEGKSNVYISKIYNVDPTNISCIRLNKSWKHIQ